MKPCNKEAENFLRVTEKTGCMFSHAFGYAKTRKVKGDFCFICNLVTYFPYVLREEIGNIYRTYNAYMTYSTSRTPTHARVYRGVAA